MNKRMDMRSAVAMIQDGDGVAVSGAMLNASPRALLTAIGDCFQETGYPRGLTIMHGAGVGDLKKQGIYEISLEGLITRYIAAHYCFNQRIIDLINDNKIQAYNLPQGVLSHMYRAAAAGKIGEITKIGLHTFCDPRQQGGKMNECTREELVELINICGEEHLLYRMPKLNIGLIRGTTADELGNITMDEEVAYVDVLDVAMAVKAMGGKVIAQVKNYVSSASIDRSRVIVPGTMVDVVVVSEHPEEDHRQTPGSFYDPTLAGHYHRDDVSLGRIPLDARKLIARRAALELKPHSLVNLGIGIPAGVGAVAGEEGIADQLILSVEIGLIGGSPTGGENFGAAYNAWASLPMSTMFDYYGGGSLTFTALGFAEVDPAGNVNVGRFGRQIAGCGGFIDISQTTKKVVFAGTMTSGGLETEVRDGKLHVLREGKNKKFVKSVEQITFSSEFSREMEQDVQFVTERCVFRLTPEGLVLTEIAPGVDLERQILECMDFVPKISPALKEMDFRIFRDEPMGLAKMLKMKE